MKEQLLIGDVGSTKSTWYYSVAAPPLHFHGYNPVMHASGHGEDLIRQLREKTNGFDFETVRYYGAGVVDHAAGQQVRQLLESYFTTSQIHVGSDLEGACRAACGHESGTVVILGTGSHAAAWDGHKIVRQAVSLGYILGDEGSGCDIGKAMIRGYFYQEMPSIIRQEMESKLPGSRSSFLSEMMKSEAPNQFLAEYARVAVMFQDHPWIKEMISSRFKEFVRIHLLPLSPQTPVHIVGSIGSIFAGLMTAELAAAGLTAGHFIKDPARKLFEQHLKQE
jgi:hypothetical protein